MFGRKVSEPDNQSACQPDSEAVTAAKTDTVLTTELPQLSRQVLSANTQQGIQQGIQQSQHDNSSEDVELDAQVYQVIREQIFASIDPSLATKLKQDELAERILQAVTSIANQQRLPLTFQAQQQIAQLLLADMIGLGPLQALLDDDSVNDILIEEGHAYNYHGEKKKDFMESKKYLWNRKGMEL